MHVNLEACINCNLCVRACREVQSNDVIGMAYRGHNSKVVFDFDDQMGSSSCVGCGECVQACPTGALMEKSLIGENGEEKFILINQLTVFVHIVELVVKQKFMLKIIKLYKLMEEMVLLTTKNFVSRADLVLIIFMMLVDLQNL